MIFLAPEPATFGRFSSMTSSRLQIPAPGDVAVSRRLNAFATGVSSSVGLRLNAEWLVGAAVRHAGPSTSGA